jgi:hypothetical protein
MRKLMDEVHFNDQGNSVTLVLHTCLTGESFRGEASA